MSLSLETLCERLLLRRTSLLLGTGAAMPSGAPSGAGLARKLWQDVANTEPQSDDLIETASVLERRYSRRRVVDVIVSTLAPLKPTGGLLGLPALNWHAVFTTNFDRLIEKAYKAAGVPLATIRSNYDMTYQEGRQDTTLYKLHGCISQDRALGHKASMILTEQDYEDFGKYRQSLFSLLESNLLTGDLLVIGQSLRDRHLMDLLKKIIRFKYEGAPGEIFILIHDQDDLRAPLLEDRGARVAFGGIDEFVHQLATSPKAKSVSSQTAGDTALPVSVVSSVEDVDQARLRESNVVKMFNGGPATYSDIRAGFTFERAQLPLYVDQLDGGDCLLAVVGSAGVGKTSLARQICSRLFERGYVAIEHKNDFPFLSQAWITYEADLRGNGKRAVLLLDECTRYMRQANLLVDHLSATVDPALKVVLTANAAQWGPRLKSPNIFRKGKVVELSRLTDSDLHALINLVDYNKDVADLVHADFKRVSRQRQFERLRERCSADMFVCLNNIFANDSLDRILLTEYEDLDEAAQEYYRYIAALESVGMRVHRQLVMRMLELAADRVASVLAGLQGIIEEFEINAKEGVYGWSTRHLVIARKITDYKFSSLDDLRQLFERIIENINPAVQTELQSIRDVCDRDFGIGRIAEARVRKSLYRKLIRIAPAERIPWHRLIREFLVEGNFEEAEYAIRDAIAAAGADSPIDRYSVRLIVARAEHTAGIAETDRVALLRKAYELATQNVDKHKSDKYAFRVLCEVAVKLVERGESPYILDEAIARMREAADTILDPEMDRELRRFEETYFRLR